MPKINWGVRAKNPLFWFQIFLSIAIPIGAYFGITGQDMTSWDVLGRVILDAVSNPFVVFTVLVSVYNALVDPTTPGTTDSSRALGYVKPGEPKNLNQTRGPNDFY